jgi:predicted amidohydrolase
VDAVRVLLAQLCPVPGDVRANVATVLRLLEAHRQADLAVFPELFLTGYTLPGIDRIALTPDDDAVRALAAAASAAGTAVVLGFAERLAAGRPGNSALCLDRSGRLAGIYRKVHLFGDEAEHFTRGDRYPVVTLCGRRVAPLICYDLEFPEPARAVAAAGAELLVTISANMAPYLPEHQLFAVARAVENRRPHVYVNRVGIESGLTFVGGSCVVQPGGELTAQLGGSEQTLVAEVAFGALLQPDYLVDRRPEVPAVLFPDP